MESLPEDTFETMFNPVMHVKQIGRPLMSSQAAAKSFFRHESQHRACEASSSRGSFHSRTFISPVARIGSGEKSPSITGLELRQGGMISLDLVHMSKTRTLHSFLLCEEEFFAHIQSLFYCKVLRPAKTFNLAVVSGKNFYSGR